MRKFDKKKNIAKANLISEQRHLESKGDVSEEHYESRDDLEGYVDAQELTGKYLWFHTNRTHRNNGKNGMIGIYNSSNSGRKTGSPMGYTNEVRLKGPIYFQTSESGSNSIQKTGHRVLIAGVSGVVIDTRNGDTGGMEEVTYNPFDAGVFHLINDGDKKEMVSADEVYFHASEDGKWSFFVKGPKFAEVTPEKGITTQPELTAEPELTNENMKKNNRILTESEKKGITKNKEKAIFESFAKTFNSIKRIDENEVAQKPIVIETLSIGNDGSFELDVYLLGKYVHLTGDLVNFDLEIAPYEPRTYTDPGEEGGVEGVGYDAITFDYFYVDNIGQEIETKNPEEIIAILNGMGENFPEVLKNEISGEIDTMINDGYFNDEHFHPSDPRDDHEY